VAVLKYKKTCDLCGQTVEIKGFSLVTEKSRKKFCCAGCLNIYRLLTEGGLNASLDTTKTTNNNEDN
jgi:Putative metal-binding domain of cation transport ATPase